MLVTFWRLCNTCFESLNITTIKCERKIDSSEWHDNQGNILQKPQVILCTASPQWSIITDDLFSRHTAGWNEDYFSLRFMASRLLHLIELTILFLLHNSQIFNFITESFGDVPIAHSRNFEIRCLIENISCENVVLDYLSHWLHATMH